MRFILAAGLVLGLGLATPVGADLAWFEGQWPEALAAASASHKPIMALFFKRGCGPCTMQDTTLAAPEVSAFAATFVNVRFDLEDPVGKAMAKRFKVVGSPNTLFFDTHGEEQDRLVGAWPPGEFLAEMKRIRSGQGTVPVLLAHAADYSADIDYNFVLGSKLSDRGDDLARQYLDRVVALDSTNTHGRTDDALLALASLARRDSSFGTAAATLEKLLSRFPQSELAGQAFHALANTYKSLGQTDRAIATLERAIAAGPNDPQRLNDLAWSLVQWKGDLGRALSASQKAVELSHDDPGFLDTLAEVHFARGEVSEAVAAEKRALEKAPANQDLKDQLARFQSAERAAQPKK